MSNNPPIRIEDHLLDKYGVYFDYHKIHERHGITFEQFVIQCQRGTWNA